MYATCLAKVFFALIKYLRYYSLRMVSVNDLSKLCQPQLPILYHNYAIYLRFLHCFLNNYRLSLKYDI